jgi:hypothetical protein
MLWRLADFNSSGICELSPTIISNFLTSKVFLFFNQTLTVVKEQFEGTFGTSSFLISFPGFYISIKSWQVYLIVPPWETIKNLFDEKDISFG